MFNNLQKQKISIDLPIQNGVLVIVYICRRIMIDQAELFGVNVKAFLGATFSVKCNRLDVKNSFSTLKIVVVDRFFYFYTYGTHPIEVFSDDV